jgi:hypothetical protein
VDGSNSFLLISRIINTSPPCANAAPGQKRAVLVCVAEAELLNKVVTLFCQRFFEKIEILEHLTISTLANINHWLKIKCLIISMFHTLKMGTCAEKRNAEYIVLAETVP